MSPDLTNRPDNRSPFWPCIWLGVALILSKAAYCGLPPEWSVSELSDWVSELLLISGSDVCFVLIVGLAAKGLLVATAQRPLWQAWVWRALLVLCTASVVYAVLGVRIYEILRMPLTYPLLHIGGDIASMQSSLGAFVSARLILVVVGAPVLYLAAVTLSQRHLVPNGKMSGQVLPLGCVALGLAWFVDSQHRQSVGDWSGTRDDHGIAQNPHWTLVQSFLSELLGGQSVSLKEDFPASYSSDFMMVQEQVGAGEPTPGLARGPKNVIVVICESVGTQMLSLYGSGFKTWPRMEAEAAHSMVFDRYYTHLTNTANSLYTLTLSSYPPLTWKQYTDERPDAAGVTTAQVLREQGYRTAYLSSSYNDWAGMSRFLRHRGYDVTLDARDALKEGEPEISSWGVEDRWLVDAIFKFIDKPAPDAAPGKPFYIFSWTQGTHHPYEPGPTWEDKDFLKGDKTYGVMSWDLGRYLNALLELDKQLGRLLDGLRARNLADDTMVIITGDHGEAFGVPHSNSVGHSGKVYQEDVNVPFMIWSPALFKTPVRSSATGAHVDLSPTVLDLLGIPLPEPWQGRSLLSPKRPQRAYFYGVMDHYLLGVRENQFKYVFNATLGRQFLFDLENDHKEQTNIASQHPDLCQELRKRLAAWVKYQQIR